MSDHPLKRLLQKITGRDAEAAAMRESGGTISVRQGADIAASDRGGSVSGVPCTTANGCFKKVDQSGGSSYPAADDRGTRARGREGPIDPQE